MTVRNLRLPKRHFTADNASHMVNIRELEEWATKVQTEFVIGVPPIGPAGGELTGTYPNPAVTTVHSGSAHHLETVINAKTYNAVGDGVANDTTPLTNWLAVSASGVLYLPPGTYLVNDLTAAANFVAIQGAGMGLTFLKARTGTTNVLTLGDGSTTFDGPVLSDLTIDGAGIAQRGIYARSNCVRGLVERVEIKGCTGAGYENENTNHSWRFLDCYIHDNSGRGVIVKGLAQYTRFDFSIIRTNALGNVLLGNGTSATNDVTFNGCDLEETTAYPNVPCIELISPISPLNVRDCYFECRGASGLFLKVGANLSSIGTTRIEWDGNYGTGNAVSNYAFEFGVTSALRMGIRGGVHTSFVTGLINNLGTVAFVSQERFHNNGVDAAQAFIPVRQGSSTTIQSAQLVYLGTGNGITLTLPAAPTNGQRHYFKNIHATGNCTIAANTAQTIDGAANQVLTPLASMIVDYDATAAQWQILSSNGLGGGGAPSGPAGGELAGAYPNPTVVAVHSGSSHAATQAAAEATAAAADAAHAAAGDPHPVYATDADLSAMHIGTRIVTGPGERLETRGPGDRGPGQVITGPALVVGSVLLGTPKVPRSNFTIPKDHIYRVDGTITTGPNIRMTTEENATLETAGLNGLSRLITPGRG